MDINKKIKYILTFYGLYTGVITYLSLYFIKNILLKIVVFFVVILIITTLFTYLIDLIQEKFQNDALKLNDK